MNIEDQIKNISKDLKPEISVLIPFYGNKNDLFKCLDGLKRQDFTMPFEVIVVESGNDPEVRQFVNSIPNAVLYSSNSKMYPGKARNLAVKNANADLFAFIDADCVPDSNWLNEIYSTLKNGYEIVIGPIKNLYPFHPVASVDNILQFVDFQKSRNPKSIVHFPACNFGITKQLFEETGGFSEDYASGEDILFSQDAIKKSNGKVLFNTRQLVRHCGRKSIAGLIKHNETLGFYRGLLNLKIPAKYMKYRKYSLYSILYGFRRFVYITIRTLQWNPVGIMRIVFYLPVVFIGLTAWVKGFRRGNKKYFEIGISNQYITEAFLK